VAVGVGGVAGTLIVAEVEWQEACCPSREAGRHRHPLGIDREMHEGTTGEGDAPWVALVAVLGDRVLDRLIGERVLQLRSGGREAVDEQRQVDRLGRAGVVGKLSRDRDPVAFVALLEYGAKPVGGLEERQLDRDAEVEHAVAQHINRSPTVDLGGEAGGEAALHGRHIVAVAVEQRIPLLGLCRADEGEQLACVEAEGRVEVGGMGS
jgi:hypothetical protein